MLAAKQLTVAIDFHCIEKSTLEVNGYRQLFGYQLPSKCLILCSTEETHTGLEQVGGEQMMTDFFILGELSL